MARLTFFTLAALVMTALFGAALSACGQAEATQSTPPHSPVPTEDAVATVIAMQAAATEVPTATPAPSATPTPTASAAPTLPPTATRTLPPAATDTSAPAVAYPTNTPRATQVVLETAAPSPTTALVANFASGAEMDGVPEHYWLARPFPRDPDGQIIDYFSRSYPYGSTSSGQFQVHHGADFPNALGTNILATADGWVVFAGGDQKQRVGRHLDFYGNAVILEHAFTAPNGETVYTLYGHMSEVDVEVGQFVRQGEKLGEVGAEGVALGSHLHLEVRLGNALDYGRTVNPDLWLRPWPGFGTVAGRVMDSSGRLRHDVTVTFEGESGPPRYTTTYADDTVNPDPLLGENFVRGDLPEGDYDVFVRVDGVLRYRGEVTVEGGETTWLDIELR